MRTRRRWLRRRRTLSAQLLAAQVLVLVLAGAIGFALWARTVRSELDQKYEQRALAIAEATASTPEVVTALTHMDPGRVQAAAEAIRRNTGASYVVVIDRFGIRYSHPNPALIGESVDRELDVHRHVGIDHGSLGPSANGRAPVFAADGTPVGDVSAGVTEADFADEARTELATLAIYLALGLAAGLVVALLLARRLKRQTFGLELDEIAALVQEREATLHGIREGVVAVDPAGRLSLVNDQAHHLLGTAPADVGRPVTDVLPDGELRALMLGGRGPDGATVTDRLVLHGGHFLVGSSRQVSEGGRELGAVVTLRDRTELEHALRELDEVRGLTDALRAQQHEFSNRMHVMSGLLELGRVDEAVGYATAIDGATAGLAAELDARISNTHVVALLVAKTTVARERGVALTVECESHVHLDDSAADALVTVFGNLIDNGIDAATASNADGVASVLVRLAEGDHELVIDVADSGPGIPAGTAESIFADGWSTKAEPGGRHRGIGLALVRQLAHGLGGRVEVREGSGARFRVILPRNPAGRTR